MGKQDEPHSLEDILDRIRGAADENEEVSVDEVLSVVGRRSFGPVLLIPGLIAFSPLSGVPGMPTVLGIMVLLIAGQLLLGRSAFWLPQFVLRRSASRERVGKALRFLNPPARFVDKLIKPRLTFLVNGAAVYVIAGLCLAMSLFTPFLELFPFVITGFGAAVTAFGLGLIGQDGLLALLAFVACIVTLYFVGTLLL